jgi:hypothetical protein
LRFHLFLHPSGRSQSLIDIWFNGYDPVFVASHATFHFHHCVRKPSQAAFSCQISARSCSSHATFQLPQGLC